MQGYGKWIALGLAGLMLLIVWGGFNGLVNKDESVTAAIAEIQNQEKRQADVIPMLVETVKGVANYEKGLLESVTKARAEAGKTVINVDPAKIAADPKALEAFMAASQQMSGALSRLLATVEKYPDLKATANFSTLQSQIEGTQNRITVARRDHIMAVRSFNASIRTFPSVVYAGAFGFKAKPTFEAPAEQRQTPKIDFGTATKS